MSIISFLFDFCLTFSSNMVMSLITIASIDLRSCSNSKDLLEYISISSQFSYKSDSIELMKPFNLINKHVK